MCMYDITCFRLLCDIFCLDLDLTQTDVPWTELDLPTDRLAGIRLRPRPDTEIDGLFYRLLLLLFRVVRQLWPTLQGRPVSSPKGWWSLEVCTLLAKHVVTGCVIKPRLTQPLITFLASTVSIPPSRPSSAHLNICALRHCPKWDHLCGIGGLPRSELHLKVDPRLLALAPGGQEAGSRNLWLSS